MGVNISADASSQKRNRRSKSERYYRPPDVRQKNRFEPEENFTFESNQAYIDKYDYIVVFPLTEGALLENKEKSTERVGWDEVNLIWFQGVLGTEEAKKAAVKHLSEFWKKRVGLYPKSGDEILKSAWYSIAREAIIDTLMSKSNLQMKLTGGPSRIFCRIRAPMKLLELQADQDNYRLQLRDEIDPGIDQFWNLEIDRMIESKGKVEPVAIEQEEEKVHYTQRTISIHLLTYTPTSPFTPSDIHSHPISHLPSLTSHRLPPTTSEPTPKSLVPSHTTSSHIPSLTSHRLHRLPPTTNHQRTYTKDEANRILEGLYKAGKISPNDLTVNTEEETVAGWSRRVHCLERIADKVPIFNRFPAFAPYTTKASLRFLYQTYPSVRGRTLFRSKDRLLLTKSVIDKYYDLRVFQEKGIVIAFMALHGDPSHTYHTRDHCLSHTRSTHIHIHTYIHSINTQTHDHCLSHTRSTHITHTHTYTHDQHTSHTLDQPFLYTHKPKTYHRLPSLTPTPTSFSTPLIISVAHTHQSINRSINQSINQSINPSINQSDANRGDRLTLDILKRRWVTFWLATALEAGAPTVTSPAYDDDVEAWMYERPFAQPLGDGWMDGWMDALFTHPIVVYTLTTYLLSQHTYLITPLSLFTPHLPSPLGDIREY